MRERIAARLRRYESVPVVGLVSDLFRRDTEAAGSLVGSAVAFRLFLFFVPLLLVLVGVAGFLSGHVDADQLNQSYGISGGLGSQIRSAFAQSGRAPWVITGVGLVGLVSTGRSLSRVLLSASSNAWQLPIERKASLRLVGAMTGLVCGMGLVALLVNRARADLGLAAAGLSLGPAFLLYALAWLVVSVLLPRGTDDPGALLPGALWVAAVFTALHAVSELYLPDRFSHASQLYGVIGTTVVTLGWFFIIGRAIVVAMELNPVVYERYGSISTLFFSLPVVRILPRRSPRLRRFFDLD
ncbi:MAG: YhjD/YihY/BrkB family envelope integrity protein [Acidimicrobiales bacterium]